ncbi:MAG: TM2 domain-containing protein [Planctomycetota bacterium]
MSSPSPNPLPPHPRPWEEKNPFIAGLLAVLIPGAGHFYQGRMLKGVIYSVSILGLFIWGQKLGEGMVVYNLPDKGGAFRHVALSYAAQLGTGACAVPALIQNRRAADPLNRPLTQLTQPMTAEFVGRLTPPEQPDTGHLVGTVRLEPSEGDYGPEMRGTFSGQLDGQKVELKLGGRFKLDKPIKAGFRRKLECGVVEGEPAANVGGRVMEGTIPRSFLDAYGSPPDPEQLQELNGRLGKLYELALVFTWIAGLLNVLVIWDCIYGPAYGFGDEHLDTQTAENSAEPAPRTESPRGGSPVSESLRPEPRAAPKAPT